MKYFIDGINFYELEAQKYWSFPKNSKKNPKDEIKNYIFSGDYIGARKVDGAFYKFLKDEDGNQYLLGRNKSVSGEYLNKIEWVPHLKLFFDSLPNGTCLLGEMFFNGNEGSNKVTTIMGCLKEKAIARQEKNEPLSYYIFDVLAYDGKILYDKNIENRIKFLNKNSFIYDILQLLPNKNIYLAEYFDGEQLWDLLQKVLSDGGEGIVMTKRGTSYAPGKRPARQTIKVKKELSETVDVFFTGKYAPATKEYKGKELETWKFWENIVTGERFIDNNNNTYKDYINGKPIIPITKGHYYGWAGSLEIGVLKDGKIYPLGYLSGLSDEIKSNVSNFSLKPFEMTAMQITDDGAFRHGKFLNWRHDLKVEDCTYEKIFG